MGILAQHGYGKGTKLDAGLRGNQIKGVILSPRDETPENLTTLANQIASNHPDAVVLMDPQFYVTTLSNPKDGNLPAYPYYESNLTRQNFSLSGMQKFVEATLAYQSSLSLTAILSPSIVLDDFSDNWSQISIWMAQHSIAYHQSLQSGKPLFISIACSEATLRSKPHLNEFLNELTALEVAGFYIVVRRNSTTYTQLVDQEVLANLMYMVYVLSTINGYSVINGYTDMYGMLCHAAGSSLLATGWNNNLRQFTLARFQPSQGGKQPRPRYTSTPLLNSILLSEADTCHRSGLSSHVLSGTQQDQILLGSQSFLDAPWTPEASVLHHWSSLDLILGKVDGRTVKKRLQQCSQIVQDAIGNYALLKNAGIPFEVATGPNHLTQWMNAMTEFKLTVGIN